MAKIGVFDSGFGGLTVLKEIVNILPQYDFVYLGDSVRAPYGSKDRDTVLEYAKEAVDYLFAHGCELVVFACNTVSAEALRKIQQEYLPEKYPKKRVLGVIIPAVEYVFENSKPKRIGVIGTEGTIKSKTYEIEIKKINPEVHVFSKACPMLAPLAEAGKTSGVEVEEYLKIYLKPIIKEKIDTLILGCTHYALLLSEIRKAVGDDIFLINPSEATAKKLANYLLRHSEIENKLAKNNTRQYFSTGSAEKFQEFGSKIMGEKINVELAKIS